VRTFECLGACDIAPMASVDGDYIGPLAPEDAGEIVGAISEGREVLPDRSIARRASVDPGALRDDTPRRDTVLPPEGDAVDRPGPTAPIELTQDAKKDDA
jgi:(2Fe-2S) ferredoxin